MTPSRSRLASGLRAGLALQLSGAAGWWLANWPERPVTACAVAALVLLGAPLTLALGMALAAWVGRDDPAAPATAGERVRAWWAEVRALFPVFYWRLPFRWRAVPDNLGPDTRGRTGVVFIHGFICNRGFWNPWMARLRKEGRAWVAVNLEPVYGCIDAYAPIVDEAVRRVAEATGRPPVLVCHSMGGLAARAWLRSAGAAGAGHVRMVVTIGSPHGGTWIARWSPSFQRNARQMRYGSRWLRELAADEAGRSLPPFVCWYSHCDNVVFPPSTATRPGADNRHVRGAAHVDLAFRPEVVAGTLALLPACDAPLG